MSIFKENKDFYPTPLALIGKMVRKLKTKPMNILEPSAGKGDIVDYLLNNHFRHYRGNISAIEIDNNLQAILKDKDIKVIDSDFLSFSAPDKFDAIIANPPFSNGEYHLLKAIDIMYRGEIVFLLNAETIKNPYSNVRKDLVNKLEELNADIEYIQNSFLVDAERKTSVEVALIHIHIDRKVEDDIFKDVNDQAEEFNETVEEKHELSTGKTIFEMVAEYNEITNLCIETIVSYFKNYRKVGEFVALNREDNRLFNDEDLTEKMQNQVNETLVKIRKSFWRKTLELKDIKQRLTQKRLAEFEIHLEKQTHMDFTENNIRNFILNLIGTYEDTLTEAVVEVFDDMTRKFAWEEDIHNKTVHYYNGWKTNDAFQVNKKVIIPFYGTSFINNWDGRWDLDYSVKRRLNDIDLVMNYFDGMNEYVSISEALEKAFAQGESKKVESTYFTLTAYKKGTLHLTFNSEDIRRRFNITASKGKGWLPKSYGTKPIQELTHEERVLVNNFEDEKTYTKKLNQPVFAKKNSLQIGMEV